MIQFGILSREQFRRAGDTRKQQGHRIALPLLDVGVDATPEQVSEFEEMSYTVRLANGTFRTSHRDRFVDVNREVNAILRSRFSREAAFRVEDRAVSHGLTAWEWAQELLEEFPNAVYEASDLVVELVELSLPGEERFVAEPSGSFLQYIRPPFVAPLCFRGPRRYPLNELVSIWGRRRIEQLNLGEDWVHRPMATGRSVRRFSVVHPMARAYSKQTARFCILSKSVFDATPNACEVLRTMNILNWSYFSEAQLRDGVQAAWSAVVPGGIWVVGRTTMDTLKNNASIFERMDAGWKLLKRIGDGSEIEQLALAEAPSSRGSA